MENTNKNTGILNIGDRNTGNKNTGNYNTGDKNTGNYNVGILNIGNYNVGDGNTGDGNTGNKNTGNLNTGDSNIGDRNTGDFNTGDHNTGDYNTVNRSTGFFNTKQEKTIKVFNKDCDIEVWENCKKPNFIYFHLTEWIYEEGMTEKEKEENPTYKTTGGYLKSCDYKEAFQKSYNNATEEDKKLLLDLPNFDADAFFEISGIDVRKKEETIIGKEINN